MDVLPAVDSRLCRSSGSESFGGVIVCSMWWSSALMVRLRRVAP
jgi:hypothetical protein